MSDTGETAVRKKRQLSAKELANLTPWKKGQSGNPNGARAHDPLKKKLSKFGNEFLLEIIELAMMGNSEEIVRIANDPNEPMIKVGLARSVSNAVKHGDWVTLERIFERITGKVPIAMDHTSAGEKFANTETPEEREIRKARIQKLTGSLKEIDG